MARLHKTPYLFYPENEGKAFWDLFMTVVLLTSCVLTPLDIAFSEEEYHRKDGGEAENATS